MRPLPYTSPAKPANNYTAASTSPRTLARLKRSQHHEKPTRPPPATWCSLLAESSSFTSVTNTHGILRCTEPRRFMVNRTGSGDGKRASEHRLVLAETEVSGRTLVTQTSTLRHRGSATFHNKERGAAQYAPKRTWPLGLLGVVVRKLTQLHVLSRGLLPGSNHLEKTDPFLGCWYYIQRWCPW